jgi:hypothetical protein
MGFGLTTRLGRWLTRVLTRQPPFDPATMAPICDFERLRYEIRPGDVLLVEGRSHVSEVIKLITQSAWTHAALYIGRLYDIEDESLRQTIQQHYNGDPNQQLVIEALLGEGTVVHHLDKYRHEHVRICRARGLSVSDAQNVIAYAISRLGNDYDVRQLLDLARFMFPYAIVPRRFRSSLFSHNPGSQTRTVCSTMLAEAFHVVDFPVLPFAQKTDDGRIQLYRRNPKLYTPKDFDYSPYFDIIKYPFFGLDDVPVYRHLPWQDTKIYCNDLNDCYIAEEKAEKQLHGSAFVPSNSTNAKKTNISTAMPSNKIGPQNINLLSDIEEEERDSA